MPDVMNTDNFHIGACKLYADGQFVGETNEEGAVVNYEADVHLHKSGTFGNTPVKGSVIGKTLSIEVWIAEHTMDNIETFFPGVLREGEKIKFGGPAGLEIQGVQLTLVPNDGTPSWYFRNAIPSTAVETAYKVNDERLIHLTLSALIDPSAPANEELGYFS